MMRIENILLSNLRSAPWRFSENRVLAHGVGPTPQRYFVPIQENIQLSLQREGQFAPIHVRPLGQLCGVYEIVDGHIVVDAAKTIGMTSLFAVVHEGLDGKSALLRYILMNLNRCGQYGHYHVKIHRMFKLCWQEMTKEQRSVALRAFVAWPPDRIDDYVELGEQDENWQKFMFIPRDEDSTAAHTQSKFEMGEADHEVRDDQ